MPFAAGVVDQLGCPFVGEIRACPESEMFEEMGEAGFSSRLRGRATLVEHLHADERETMVLQHDHGQPIWKMADLGAVEVELRMCRCRARDCGCKNDRRCPHAPSTAFGERSSPHAEKQQQR